MKKFEVEITETLQRTVTVEAASQEEAERMVDRGWRDGDYVLTDEDYVGSISKRPVSTNFRKRRCWTFFS
ncbi:MAG: DpnD/PcfM family protein [Faecalibacterium sp.]